MKHLILWEDPHGHLAFPALAAGRDGAILLFCRRARDPRWAIPEGLNAVGWLSHWDPRSCITFGTIKNIDDHIEEKPDNVGIVPIDPDYADQDASLLRLSDGSLLLCSFGWYPFTSGSTSFTAPPSTTESLTSHGTAGTLQLTSFICWGAFTLATRDEGITWSPRNAFPPLNPNEQTRSLQNRGATRGTLVERNGTVMGLAYALGAGGKYGAHVFRITHGGDCEWGASLSMPEDIGNGSLLEPSLVATDEGDLIAFFRTSKIDDRIVSARSTDSGATFGEWTSHQAVGHPCMPLRLRDGRIAIAYGYRQKPYGIRLRVMKSDGRNLDDAKEIILRDDGRGADLGYPWMLELDDGRILVAYYWISEDYRRRIEATIIEPETFAG